MPMRGRRGRSRRDDGAAMIEFAFVGVLLVVFALGIINFGLILSFKQDLTRAAAEGARVGAVAQPPTITPATAAADPRHSATVAATEDAVDSFGKTCVGNADGLTCDVIIHDCAQPPIAGSTAYWNNGDDDCVTVELIYDYNAAPLLAQPPILAGALPDELKSKSVARLNE